MTEKTIRIEVGMILWPDNEPEPCTVTEIKKSVCFGEPIIGLIPPDGHRIIYFPVSEIGKSLFLSKAEKEGG